MSMSPICGAESTLVHLAMQRPVGSLICAAVIGGVMSMTGAPDAFGGCGEAGGGLHSIVALTDDPQLACAKPEAAPIQKEP